jgi:hypothetical protein
LLQIKVVPIGIYLVFAVQGCDFGNAHPYVLVSSGDAEVEKVFGFGDPL